MKQKPKIPHRVRTAGLFARKLTSFALCCYVIGLFNRPQGTHKHNRKECFSVVSSRLPGGAPRGIPKNGCEGDFLLTERLEEVTCVTNRYFQEKSFFACWLLSCIIGIPQLSELKATRRNFYHYGYPRNVSFIT